MRCCCHLLGEVPYRRAWALQKRLAAEIAAGQRPPTLLLLSHPPTYTFGRRGRPEHLLLGEEEARRRGFEVVWSDRGGDITYHGPGQVVGYPLLPLAPLRPHAEEEGSRRLPTADYVGYLRRLEAVLLQALTVWGVRGFRMAGMTGVWVRLPGGEPAKIAAIGVRVDARGVSRHGFALNVATDPAHWQGIVGCGLHGYAVANLADILPHPPAWDDVVAALAAAFAAQFRCRWQPCDAELPDGIIATPCPSSSGDRATAS